MDINSLIASYLQNNSNTEVDASKIKDTFNELANGARDCDSIFVYGEDATKEELIEYMSKACGKDDDQFKEDVGLLFDVLNSNSDDDVLTTDEMDILTRTRGEHKGKIDGFGIWNELLNTDVSQIESEMADLQLSSEVKSIVESGNAESMLSAYAVVYGEDSAEYKELEQRILIESASTEQDSSSGFSTEDINRMAQDIYAGKSTLEDVKNTGKLSDEEFAALEAAVKTLQDGGTIDDTTTTDSTESSQGTTTTDGATDAGATTETDDTDDVAVEDSPADVTYTASPEDTESTTVSTEAKIPNDAAENYAKELLNGVAASSPTKIREYLDLDSADLVKVLSTYSESYGSLTKAIEGGLAEYLTKAEREEFINTIMTACIEQAENGNDEAVKILCNEIYSATAQTWGYTGYTVLDSFFQNADNSVITKVKDNYSTYVEGHDLRGDINGEAMWFHQNEKTSYIAKIDKAWQEET